MIVTDPCYDSDSWANGVVDRCQTGNWLASIAVKHIKDWGDRVTQLTVTHETAEEPLKWQAAGFDVGVDSGSAGVFDFEKYPEYPKSDEDELELSVPEAAKLHDAGTCAFGAASRSGLGDGAYDCLIAKKNGKVVGIKIVFLDEALIASTKD